MPLAEELHKILYSDLSWHDKASCKGATDVFFSDKGQNDKTRNARDICRQCPVVNDCLNYAIKNNIRHGVWGGYSYRERLKIKQGSK